MNTTFLVTDTPFGLTTDPMEAGYMAPDGSSLGVYPAMMPDLGAGPSAGPTLSFGLALHEKRGP